MQDSIKQRKDNGLFRTLSNLGELRDEQRIYIRDTKNRFESQVEGHDAEWNCVVKVVTLLGKTCKHLSKVWEPQTTIG